MQRLGLEWAYRIYLEPRRLSGRYLVTNPHALFLLLTRTGRTVSAPMTRSVTPP
jgi:UDP-N-acetyl-D-mannosaminuronic acid transferase (WecB/TagA/CpsF family)